MSYWTEEDTKSWPDDRLLDTYWRCAVLCMHASAAGEKGTAALKGWTEHGLIISNEMSRRGIKNREFYPKFDAVRHAFINSSPNVERNQIEWARMHGEEWRVAPELWKSAA